MYSTGLSARRTAGDAEGLNWHTTPQAMNPCISMTVMIIFSMLEILWIPTILHLANMRRYVNTPPPPAANILAVSFLQIAQYVPIQMNVCCVCIRKNKSGMLSGDGHLTRVKAALIGEPEIEWPPLPTIQYFSLYHYSIEPSILRNSTPSPSFSSLHHPSLYYSLSPTQSLHTDHLSNGPVLFPNLAPPSALFFLSAIKFPLAPTKLSVFFRLSSSSFSLFLLFLSLFPPSLPSLLLVLKARGFALL